MGQFTQQVADLDDAGRIQPIGRLVQNQQLGIVHQRLGQPQSLRIAQRQRARPPISIGGQPKLFDDAINAVGSTPGAGGASSPDFGDGQIGIGVGRLDQIADGRPGSSRPPTRRAQHVGLPGVGLIMPNNMRMVVVLPAPLRPRKA